MIKIVKHLSLSLIAAFFSSGVSFGQEAKSLIGLWRNETDEKKISEFFKESDGFYYGKIYSDKVNPENVGKTVMKKLKFDRKDKNFVGVMSPPDKKIELEITITFITADRIKVVGKKFLFTKTFYFSRIKK